MNSKDFTLHVKALMSQHGIKGAVIFEKENKIVLYASPDLSRDANLRMCAKLIHLECVEKHEYDKQLEEIEALRQALYN